MKHLLIALLLAPALAHASNGDAVLRAECAAKNQVAAKSAAAAHSVAKDKRALRGDVQKRKAMPCTESQYSAYLASLDPARVLALNPSAAGSKPAAEKQAFTYKKGKLAAQ